jgi:hypothetical protein
MSVRFWRGVGGAALAAALALGGSSLATAKISLPKFPAPAKKAPITLETILGQLKVELLGQGYMSYVVDGRDRRGQETDTPQTDSTTYTDVSWPDRCVVKIKSKVSIQDNVDEGWHEFHDVDEQVDLHKISGAIRAIPYADYLTRKGEPNPKAQPEVRYRVDPHTVLAIPVGSAVLVATDRKAANGIIHDLVKAGAMCAAEAKEAEKATG